MVPHRNHFQELLQRVREGCQEAMNQLVETYGEYILRIVRRRLQKKIRNLYDSADVTQAVWQDFFGKEVLEQAFAGPREMIAFLAKITANKVGMLHRHHLENLKRDENRNRPLDSAGAAERGKLVEPSPGPVQRAQTDDEWDQLLAAQRPVQRQLLLWLRDGWTYADIADKFGVSPKTVQRLVATIRRQAQD